VGYTAINNKVVVTGGAGFIGSHISQELADRGYQVNIIDNLSTGSNENIADLVSKGKATLTRGNILDLPLLHKIFQEAEFVFHQAAATSVPLSVKDPEKFNLVNIGGTLNVLLAAREQGVKKVIYASSSSIYGDTPTLPKVEDMQPNPQSPYAVSKLTGEHYCQVFQQIFGVKTICLRYFNVYGPRQNPSSEYAAVIPKFISRIISSQGPIIYGDGEQSRDFTYVKDVVEANILAAESDATGVFNIGAGKGVTINELAKLCMNMLSNYCVSPVYAEPRPGDVKDSLADISRAKTFGYSPKYDLEKGLHETVRSFTGEG
jgi:UDP-glucose 4-epimerase